MIDSFGRNINYLRISVTDRCNLRCIYCMPEDGISLKSHNDMLSYEKIVQIAKAGSKLGITKLRLTGGEPLVRKGIESLVNMLANIDGIEQIGMTTNGVLLKKYAMKLKENGLTSINISLDTLDPEKYHEVTRIGNIENVLEGIDEAIKCGFPIKINKVVFSEEDRSEIEQLQKFCNEKGMKLQLINHFDLTTQKIENYEFDRPPKCPQCNRLRLLADGLLKPCLHSDIEVKVDFDNIERSFKEALAQKPKAGETCSSRNMSQIGG